MYLSCQTLLTPRKFLPSPSSHVHAILGLWWWTTLTWHEIYSLVHSLTQRHVHSLTLTIRQMTNNTLLEWWLGDVFSGLHERHDVGFRNILLRLANTMIPSPSTNYSVGSHNPWHVFKWFLRPESVSRVYPSLHQYGRSIRIPVYRWINSSTEIWNEDHQWSRRWILLWSLPPSC